MLENASASGSEASAPEHPLPTTHFYSVEYPGYVRTTSVAQAVTTLGGKSSMETAFRRNASKQDALLELNMRPDNPFSHPIPGDLASTNNILLKVVKRKRRKANYASAEGDGLVGEYTAAAIGVIPKTARFRSEYRTAVHRCRTTFILSAGMADYQFQPDMSDPVAKLRIAMMNMDGER